MVKRGSVLIGILVLAGCGKSEDDTALGGKLTQAESQALSDAAAMLEEGGRAEVATKRTDGD